MLCDPATALIHEQLAAHISKVHRKEHAEKKAVQEKEKAAAKATQPRGLYDCRYCERYTGKKTKKAVSLDTKFAAVLITFSRRYRIMNAQLTRNSTNPGE